MARLASSTDARRRHDLALVLSATKGKRRKVDEFLKFRTCSVSIPQHEIRLAPQIRRNQIDSHAGRL
jgi:hypothetical protein